MRDFYFIKYSSAYISEYFLCYKRIFSKGFLLENENVSALSVGCGAMLDLVGFETARKNSQQFFASTPFYYGVDIVDWNCGDTAIIGNIVFSPRGIENFEVSNCRQPLDVICFPKSLSDIPIRSILDFASSLNKDNVQNRFCVIVSKRGESISDSDAIRQFVDTLARKLNFHVTKEEREAILTSESDYFEDHLATPFEFDTQIVARLQGLVDRRCAPACAAKAQCKEIIGKWPMRKVTNIHPEIYYLEKN